MEDTDSKLAYYIEFAARSLELAVVKQVEYYFSDENLPGDEFLFVKTMKRNSRAYVKVKILLTFRKLKALTHDINFVAEAIRRHSTILEVNSNGLSIRRITNLANSLVDERKRFQRSVRIDNLPKNPSIKEIEAQLAHIGKVRSTRIVHGIKGNSKDVYAIVEFEASSAVNRALRGFRDMGWRGGFRVSRLRRENNKDATTENVKDGENVESNEQDIGNIEYEGKIRSIDAADKCGFIVPMITKTTKRKKQKSIYFSFDNVTNTKVIKAGISVRYKMRKNRSGDEQAFDIRAISTSEHNGNETQKKAPAGFMTMAKGPPKNAEYRGFTDAEYRGVRGKPDSA